MIWAMIILTEGDWYVSYDKTLFGRENGRYKKEQSEQLMNSCSLLNFKDRYLSVIRGCQEIGTCHLGFRVLHYYLSLN